jgi:hypothetical protein
MQEVYLLMKYIQSQNTKIKIWLDKCNLLLIIK